MKKFPVVIALFSGLLLAGCKNEEAEKPKVIYENTSKPKAQPASDTSEIEIADLPIQVLGTNVIVHPIGNYRVDGRRRAGYEYERGSFTISNFSEFELTGFLKNIKFEDLATGNFTDLTDKPVLIQTATFLAGTDKKRQAVVYMLSDMDTNKDSKLDANDVRTLYVSGIDGQNLVKISPDFHELIDWNYMEARHRIYFRTIEDTNKSGEFDNKDLLHYHFVDLQQTEWKAEEYDPVKSFNP